MATIKYIFFVIQIGYNKIFILALIFYNFGINFELSHA